MSHPDLVVAPATVVVPRLVQPIRVMARDAPRTRAPWRATPVGGWENVQAPVTEVLPLRVFGPAVVSAPMFTAPKLVVPETARLVKEPEPPVNEGAVVAPSVVAPVTLMGPFTVMGPDVMVTAPLTVRGPSMVDGCGCWPGS
jgi:hypothetical protein